MKRTATIAAVAMLLLGLMVTPAAATDTELVDSRSVAGTLYWGMSGGGLCADLSTSRPTAQTQNVVLSGSASATNGTGTIFYSGGGYSNSKSGQSVSIWDSIFLNQGESATFSFCGVYSDAPWPYPQPTMTLHLTISYYASPAT